MLRFNLHLDGACPDHGHAVIVTFVLMGKITIPFPLHLARLQADHSDIFQQCSDLFRGQSWNEFVVGMNLPMSLGSCFVARYIKSDNWEPGQLRVPGEAGPHTIREAMRKSTSLFLFGSDIPTLSQGVRSHFSLVSVLCYKVLLGFCLLLFLPEAPFLVWWYKDIKSLLSASSEPGKSQSQGRCEGPLCPG